MVTTFGLLVSYNHNYTERSIREFRELVYSFDKNAIILVVNNNTNISYNKDQNLMFRDVDYIQGSNESWEFSAWQEGLQYLADKYEVSSTDNFVFANDTFCHHRFFNTLDKFLFLYKLKGLSHNELLGEVCSLDGEIFEYSMNHRTWISTYLFATKFDTIRRLLPLDAHSNDDILIDPKSRLVKISGFTQLAETHLRNWLMPNEGRGGWYKSHSVDMDMLINKTKAIANEKSLSRRAVESNIALVDIYNGNMATFYKKAKRKFYNLLRR
ncbi:hypothetical protein AB6C90_012615 [Vibrio cyclitrophicus]